MFKGSLGSGISSRLHQKVVKYFLTAFGQKKKSGERREKTRENEKYYSPQSEKTIKEREK